MGGCGLLFGSQRIELGFSAGGGERGAPQILLATLNDGLIPELCFARMGPGQIFRRFFVYLMR